MMLLEVDFYLVINYVNSYLYFVLDNEKTFFLFYFFDQIEKNAKKVNINFDSF